MREKFKFYWLSVATFYDCIYTIYQFISPLLGNKMSFIRSMEPLIYIPIGYSESTKEMADVGEENDFDFDVKYKGIACILPENHGVNILVSECLLKRLLSNQLEGRIISVRKVENSWSYLDEE